MNENNTDSLQFLPPTNTSKPPRPPQNRMLELGGETEKIINASQAGGEKKSEDPYKVTVTTEELIRFIFGVQLNDENTDLILQTMEEDQKIVRAKYGLPPIDMLYDNPREYERRLREIAKEIGVTILPKIACGGFFEETSLAGAVFIDPEESANPKIVVDIRENSEKEYISSLHSLEHELIHALQWKRYPGMPIERQEYEAYIASCNIGYFKKDPKAIKKALFDFFIGGSVRNYYRLENEKAKKRGLPPIKPPYQK